MPVHPTSRRIPHSHSHSIAACPISTHAIVLTDSASGTILSASEAARRVLFPSALTQILDPCQLEQSPLSTRDIVAQKWSDLVSPVHDHQRSNITLDTTEPLETLTLFRILSSKDDEENDDELENTPECRYVQACGHAIDEQVGEDEGTSVRRVVLWFLDDVTHVRDLSKAVETTGRPGSDTELDDDHAENLDDEDEETQTIVVRINNCGRILQSFPMMRFLGRPTQDLLNRFVMRFVAEEDVGELCRGLSRACRPFGYAVFMVRWSWAELPEQEDDVREGDTAMESAAMEPEPAAEAEVAPADELKSGDGRHPALPPIPHSSGIAQSSGNSQDPDTIAPAYEDFHGSPGSLSPPPSYSRGRRRSILEMPAPPPPPPTATSASHAAPQPPTWVHFTVGPCPTPGNDTPDGQFEDDPGSTSPSSRHLLCLVQIARARVSNPPSTSTSSSCLSSTGIGSTSSTVYTDSHPSSDTRHDDASFNTHLPLSFLNSSSTGHAGWRDRLREVADLVEQAARWCGWILWRVCWRLPGAVVGNVVGKVLVRVV
ncbi:hypothetical protein HKX48_003390 [Thoreauomyces humboldtii]|nr:hypothetical protein HKX48_003390 [Thoreauomyces humboldtii]